MTQHEHAHPDAGSHADNHGNTPAAWTGVTVILIGFAVGAVGIVVGSWPTFWAGVAVAVLGLAVGYVMSLLGFGARRREHPEVPADRAPDLP